MKLRRLRAKNYRSLREEEIELSELNLFIGANASGKSTILDALRFLHGGIQVRDFRVWVSGRGGITNLIWKEKIRIASSWKCSWKMETGALNGLSD